VPRSRAMRAREPNMLVTTLPPATRSKTSIGCRSATDQASAVTSWSGETSSAT